MALPDAPTITTEEELNKLLAQIQGGMTPPTIKRDSFGNIVVTQNGEATMVPLTFYRTDAFGQLLKQAGEKVDDVSYQQSLVGRLADLTAEVEIQSLKDRGTPEESIDTESIKKKALGGSSNKPLGTYQPPSEIVGNTCIPNHLPAPNNSRNVATIISNTE